MYEVEDVDVYSFMKGNLSYFDTSNYAEDKVYNMPRVNASVVLKLKDETAGVPIREFVALGAKQYAFKLENEKEEKKSKGVKKNVLKRKITFEDYKNSLFNDTVNSQDQCTINSKNHYLYTIKRRKIALNPRDDKRVLTTDFFTLPIGHTKLSS